MSMNWTPRNTVSVVLVLLTATAYALAAFGVVHFDFVSNGKIEAYAMGFGLGVIMPGSPIGRVLDKVFPPKGTAAQSITGEDVAAVIAQVQEGDARATAAARPQRIPPSSTAGSAAIDLLGVVLVIAGAVLGWLRYFAAALLVCVLASGAIGCGASALSMQARAATIAGVGLGSVGQQIHDDRTAELDACTDIACEDAGEAKWAPAVAALESVRTALTTWVDALDVARQAGEPDSDILGALLVAVSHLAHEWNDLAAALRAVDVPLPDLPPAVTALLAAVSA